MQWFDLFLQLIDVLEAYAQSPWRLFATLVTFGVSIIAFRYLRKHVAWVRRSSRLRDPQALSLQARRIFVGRESEVSAVAGLCAQSPLVFMVGSSGVGKSYLTTERLIPRLRQDAQLFPLYVGLWGDDWEEGPAAMLARAAVDELGGHMTVPQDPAIVVGAIAATLYTTGRTPLLIFDQFEDYQARHFERFVRNGRLLAATELVADNAFWRSVAAELAKKVVRCLFVFRDTSLSESVRFGEPRVYLLEPPPPGSALALLERLTAKDATRGVVVASPHAGFSRLKELLCEDLDKGERLPAEMEMAFLSLASLRPLTDERYVEQGRLSGLIAGYTHDRIRRAADATGLSVDAVLDTVMELVDRRHHSTPIRSENELRVSTQDHDVDPARLHAALEQLKVARVVRKQILADRETTAWQLHHAYLGHALLRLEPEARRWHGLLDEAFAAFEQSRGLFRRWRALLPPWLLLALLWQTLRRRVRWSRAQRFYGARSVARLAVNWVVLISMLGYYAWSRQQVSVRANEVFDAFDTSSALNPIEVRALRRLAAEGGRSARAVRSLPRLAQQRRTLQSQRPLHSDGDPRPRTAASPERGSARVPAVLRARRHARRLQPAGGGAARKFAALPGAHAPGHERSA